MSAFEEKQRTRCHYLKETTTTHTLSLLHFGGVYVRVGASLQADSTAKSPIAYRGLFRHEIE